MARLILAPFALDRSPFASFRVSTAHFVISEIRLRDAVPSVVQQPYGSARMSFAFATEQCAGIEVAVLRCIATSTDREGDELLAERG